MSGFFRRRSSGNTASAAATAEPDRESPDDDATRSKSKSTTSALKAMRGDIIEQAKSMNEKTVDGVDEAGDQASRQPHSTLCSRQRHNACTNKTCFASARQFPAITANEPRCDCSLLCQIVQSVEEGLLALKQRMAADAAKGDERAGIWQLEVTRAVLGDDDATLDKFFTNYVRHASLDEAKAAKMAKKARKATGGKGGDDIKEAAGGDDMKGAAAAGEAGAGGATLYNADKAWRRLLKYAEFMHAERAMFLDPPLTPESVAHIAGNFAIETLPLTTRDPEGRPIIFIKLDKMNLGNLAGQETDLLRWGCLQCHGGLGGTIAKAAAEPAAAAAAAAGGDPGGDGKVGNKGDGGRGNDDDDAGEDLRTLGADPGFMIVEDLSNMSLREMMKFQSMDKTARRKYEEMTQGMFPLRMGKMVLAFPPWWMRVLMSIFSWFLSKKMRSRIQLVTRSNLRRQLFDKIPGLEEQLVARGFGKRTVAANGAKSGDGDQEEDDKAEMTEEQIEAFKAEAIPAADEVVAQ